MKIAIAMVQVPFIKGGAEIHAQMLCDELKKRGHEADIITIPFKWYPVQSILDSMMMGRMMDLSEVNGEKIDMVIAMKFPAFYVKHENKVIWLLHQHRQAYDLWGTPYGDLEHMEGGKEVREIIKEHDIKYLGEARKIFTNAENTKNRLYKYNGLESEALYHPPLNYEKLEYKELGDFVFYPSRIDQIKRQRVLVEAARYLKSDAKVIIAGGGSKAEIEYLNSFSIFVKISPFPWILLKVEYKLYTTSDPTFIATSSSSFKGAFIFIKILTAFIISAASLVPPPIPA